MKNKLHYLFFGILYVAFCSVNAQQNTQELDCKFNFQEALFYLKGDENFKRDSLKAINYLLPCVEKENDNAQLLLGRLYAAKKTEEGYTKAFKLLKKSAKQDNPIAMADLGILYKYGRGCKLNYNKARKWFKKAAKLGNSKASYSLGYLYLKGLGTISQDYSKAVKWFEKSEHPMANYWLGVCYLNGYGVEKNLNKANELLGTNLTTTNQYQASSVNTEEVITQVNNFINQQDNEEENYDITNEIILGQWKGKLIKLDWSENKIDEKLDVNLEIKIDSLSGALQSLITYNETSINDEIIKLDNSIYFNNTTFIIPHKSYNKNIPSELTYDILSVDLKLKTFNGVQYLVGNTESYISNWNEPGAPIRFVLKKVETFENSSEELSDEVLKALSEQEENFIKLYPNPFQNDLIISYTLESYANTKVQINDLQGNLKAVITNSKNQQKGNYKYFFDASTLPKGVYVVSVFVNNERKTRVIVKK